MFNSWKLQEGILEDTEWQTFKNNMKTRRWLASPEFDADVIVDSYDKFLDVCASINEDIPDYLLNNLSDALTGGYSTIAIYQEELQKNIDRLLALADAYNVLQQQKAEEEARKQRENDRWGWLGSALNVLSIAASIYFAPAGIATQAILGGALAGGFIGGTTRKSWSGVLEGASAGASLMSVTGASSAAAGKAFNTAGLLGATGGIGYTAVQGGDPLELIQAGSKWGGYTRTAQGVTQRLDQLANPKAPVPVPKLLEAQGYTQEQWDAMDSIARQQTIQRLGFVNQMQIDINNEFLENLEHKVEAAEGFKDLVNTFDGFAEGFPDDTPMQEIREAFKKRIIEAAMDLSNVDFDALEELLDDPSFFNASSSNVLGENNLTDIAGNTVSRVNPSVLNDLNELADQFREQTLANINNAQANIDSAVRNFQEASLSLLNAPAQNSLIDASKSQISTIDQSINMGTDAAKELIVNKIELDELYGFYILALGDGLLNALRGQGTATIQQSFIQIIDKALIYELPKLRLPSGYRKDAEGYRINGANTASDVQDMKGTEQTVKFLSTPQGLEKSIDEYRDTYVNDFDLATREAVQTGYAELKESVDKLIAQARRISMVSQHDDIKALAAVMGVESPV